MLVVDSKVILDVITADPREACFLAAMAQADDRKRGGQRSMLLPDVLIGARPCRRAFPGLRLILP